MKFKWFHFNLPFLLLLSAGLTIGGGLFAISEANRMVQQQGVVERQVIFLFETNRLQQEVEAADTALRRYFSSNDVLQFREFEFQMQRSWTQIRTIWHLDEDEAAWLMQCALHDVHQVLDRQARAFARKGFAKPAWEGERQEALELLSKRTQLLRGDILPAKVQKDIALSARNLRLSVFVTPFLALLMLLAAFRYMYRMQKLENEQTKAMSRAKSQFLANMSHEIRTPLTAVVGFAEVLSQPPVSPALREKCVSGLKRNGNLLLNLVNDILDLSKIEAQKLEIHAVPFDLGETIREVEAVMGLKAQERGIILEVNLDPSADGSTCGDPLRIKQILLNIVGNAVKFTLRGMVRVTAAVNGDGMLTVRVSDTGIGIPLQSAKRLFQPFTQIDSSNERNFGGTGLGLTISRQLARAMGGDVRLLSSAEDRGSTFEINIMLAKSVTPSVPEVRSAPLPVVGRWRGKSILVVDDSEDNRELVEMYLRTTGIRVVSVGSGDEALHVIRNEAPDAILMDIQMPVKNGYDTAREIRDLGKQMPIIAFTAHVLLREIDHCRASGCDAVLTKPVLRENLYAVLDNYLCPPA